VDATVDGALGVEEGAQFNKCNRLGGDGGGLSHVVLVWLASDGQRLFETSDQIRREGAAGSLNLDSATALAKAGGRVPSFAKRRRIYSPAERARFSGHAR